MDRVAEANSRSRPGNRDPDRGQVVELSDRASEGGLAALVGPGDDEQPLSGEQLQVVGHDPLTRRIAAQCERQVEQVAGLHPGVRGSELRIAERQAGVLQRPDQVEPREVEPHLVGEGRDGGIQEGCVPLAERFQRLEHGWIQTANPFQDADLHRVHVDGAEDVDRHGRGNRRSAEPRERGEDLGAVVRFEVVSPHDDPVLVNAQSIRDSGQLGEQPARVPGEGHESGGVDVGAQGLAGRRETA